jgi:hypothetical protein
MYFLFSSSLVHILKINLRADQERATPRPWPAKSLAQRRTQAYGRPKELGEVDKALLMVDKVIRGVDALLMSYFIIVTYFIS